MVGAAKATKVARLEGNGRIERPRPGDERRREVEPRDGDAAIGQIAGDMARNARPASSAVKP
jgi:hypothetical protein